ncbi:hypothetical protein N0V85_009850, partial [Neurospora sp. IMI 360204]
MASSANVPMESVETTTLTIWEPADYDKVMGNTDLAVGSMTIADPPSWLIALHDQVATAHRQIRDTTLAIGQEQAKGLSTLRHQYDELRDNYNLAVTMFRRGLEASHQQIAKFEQQVQDSSNKFASEVWTAVAKFGKKDVERQIAIDHLREISQQHQQALKNLDERNARQQSILGRVETWANTKDSQINDILNQLVDPRQLKDLEEQIAAVQRNTQKAIQEAFERSGQKAPDAASVLR